jgi:hypothetical protein
MRPGLISGFSIQGVRLMDKCSENCQQVSGQKARKASQINPIARGRRQRFGRWLRLLIQFLVELQLRLRLILRFRVRQRLRVALRRQRHVCGQRRDLYRERRPVL